MGMIQAVSVVGVMIGYVIAAVLTVLIGTEVRMFLSSLPLPPYFYLSIYLAS